MKKLLTVFVAFAALSGALMLPAVAQDTDTVSATVTPCTVAASVADGGVAYGTVDLGTSKNTVEGDPNGGALETQTVTNTGTCPADLRVKSSDALRTSDDTLDWELFSPCGNAGAEQFGHQFEVNNALGGSPTTFTGIDFPADNAYTQGVGVVPALVGTATLDVGICMPASTGNSSEKTITITALLVAQ
jgi:hypothetical protein